MRKWWWKVMTYWYILLLYIENKVYQIKSWKKYDLKAQEVQNKGHLKQFPGATILWPMTGTMMGLISLNYMSDIYIRHIKIRLFSKTKKIGLFEGMGITKPPNTNTYNNFKFLTVFRAWFSPNKYFCRALFCFQTMRALWMTSFRVGEPIIFLNVK